MVGIDRFDALGYCSDQRVIALFLPTVKIVAVQPGDVGILLVAVAEVFAIGGRSLEAVVTKRLKPACRLDGIDEDQYVVLCRELDDMVQANEIGLVGLGEVILGVIFLAVEERGEGTNTVRGGGVGVGDEVPAATEYVDPPHGVEPVGLTIGPKGVDFLFVQPGYQTLRRITDDQERSVVLVDQVAVVGADLDWIDGCTCGWRSWAIPALRRIPGSSVVGKR